MSTKNDAVIAWERRIGAGAGFGPVTVNGYTIDPSNPNFAALVSASGSMNGIDFTSTAACAPVKAFQAAWNNAGGTPQLTVDGGYGPDSGYANAAVGQLYGGNVPAGLTSGFPNCGGGNPPTPPQPPPGPIQPSSNIPKWAWWLIGILAGGAVLGLGFWLYKKSRRGAHEPRRGRRRGRRRSRR